MASYQKRLYKCIFHRLGLPVHSVHYSYSFLTVDTLREVVTLTFDLLILVSGQLAGHIVNPSTKFEDPMAICSLL